MSNWPSDPLSAPIPLPETPVPTQPLSRRTQGSSGPRLYQTPGFACDTAVFSPNSAAQFFAPLSGPEEEQKADRHVPFQSALHSPAAILFRRGREFPARQTPARRFLKQRQKYKLWDRSRQTPERRFPPCDHVFPSSGFPESCPCP